ncbi:hypothetical protein ACFYT4_34670 [Streptomyces sp. NPDC004609]|uniref:hypothetical protein n=1 Tax=Streptomyces sp. NPDC004609 TaxID=3364704 RepID=UPI0036A397A3
MSVLPPASTSPEPQSSRHLLAEDLDAMLTAAVLEASDAWDDDLDQPAGDQLIDGIRALVRPAWLLSPVRDGGPAESGEIGGSRIGGVPDLPQGPLVFTADATVEPAFDDGRWSTTESWVY